MENKVTADLLKRYFAGNCTTDEEACVENWLLANPENASLVMQWQEGMCNENDLLFKEIIAAEQEVWHKTQEITFENSALVKTLFLPANETAAKERKKIKKAGLKAAAVLSGIVLLAFGLHIYWINRLISVQTAYGQMRSLILPDNSVVRLNGNSKISYKASWQGKSREVWLEGEAFFEVTHMANHQKFLVHLSGKKNIEVLGTEFNVSDRTTGSLIMLKSGKIKLNLQEQTDDSGNNIFLEPGELVEVVATKNQKDKIKKSVVNPQMYYAWTDGKWVLEATSLEEMLQRLQETYGIFTVVNNKELLKRRASGSIPLPSENVEPLIIDIANLFELTIQKQNNRIFLDSIQ